MGTTHLTHSCTCCSHLCYKDVIPLGWFVKIFKKSQIYRFFFFFLNAKPLVMVLGSLDLLYAYIVLSFPEVKGCASGSWWDSHLWIFVGNAVGPENPYFLVPEAGLQDSKGAGLIETYWSWPVHCSTVDPQTCLNYARPFIWEFSIL